jgi:drug/metabolite transporter superfamily protein YnfA
MEEPLSLYLFLANLSSLSSFFPAIISLIYFRRLKDEPYTHGLAILFFSLAVGEFIGSFIFGIILKKYNMPWFHISTLLEFSLFGWAYYQKLKYLKKILPVVLLVLGISIVINSLFFVNPLLEMGTYGRAVNSIFLITMALLYFYQLFSQREVIALEKQTMFWISAGILVYYGGSVLITSFYDLLLKQKQNLTAWNVHSVLNMLGNILFGLAMLCPPKSTQS